jgi:pyrroline-5-carboxylate reductase
MNHSVLILGGGNMGGAIAQALHALPDFSVTVVESDEDKRKHFAVLGIPAYATLEETSPTDVVMLAIKPQLFASLAPTLTAQLGHHTPLLLSIMAGISLDSLRTISPRAVRAMPNLAATIHESMSVLCAPALDDAARALAESVFVSIGAVAWVEHEEQLHAVTAVSGSGPAYLFALMEAMEQAALAQGLNAALAKKLVLQTVRGSALLADGSNFSASELRAQVTSKGGTTEAALAHISAGQLQAIITSATKAAANRSRELANV